MVLQKRFVLKTKYVGMPKASNFEYQEVEIDDSIEDGEYFYEALYISVDPYIRAHPDITSKDNLGKIIPSFQLSRILKSKHPDFPVGYVVLQGTGWCNVGKHDGTEAFTKPYSYDEKTVSQGISTLGMTGLTAYFGLENCEPKEGETVMVTTGGGAVGTVVGQLAKIKGCRVIGSCGSDDKVALMKSIGYDDAFNYKTCSDWTKAIKQMAPNGIDCFFDNVGGEMANSVYLNMNQFGRITGCGCICNYLTSEPIKMRNLMGHLIFKEVTLRGFVISSPRYRARFQEAIEEMKIFLQEGKLKSIENVTDGFENIPKAFIEMFEGKNFGKAIIKI